MTSEQFAAAIAPVTPRLSRLVKNIIRSEDDVDDVVQEALMAAWSNRDKFRGTCQFSTWLHRIAANESLEWLRRRKSRKEQKHLSLSLVWVETEKGCINVALANALCDARPTVEELLLQQEALQLQQVLLGRIRSFKLPPAQREAIDLRLTGKKVPQGRKRDLWVAVQKLRQRLIQ